MKKVALTLAGVIAAAAFAPEASAIPAFARQTGMACSACHFQHFPVLAPFGRAFKAGGFTMMGSQGQVEGEHLSIPNTLNSAILLKAAFNKTDGTDPANTISGTTTNSGAFAIPDELSLFFGGRVAEGEKIKVGMMMENNLAAPGAPLIAGLRVPIVADLGVATVQVIPFATDALGALYGYTESSAGTARGIRWMESRKAISAHQWVGLGAGAATGTTVVAHTDMGYATFAAYAPTFTLGTASGAQMSSNVISLVATPTIADWSIVAGVELFGGKGYDGDPAVVTKKDTAGTGADFQAQGKIADMETSLYATYATAPSGGYFAGATSTQAASAFSVGADVTVLPHTLSVGASYRSGTNGSGKSDNSIAVAGIYDLFQNVALHANYQIFSGDVTSAAGSAKSQLTLLLESAW